MMSSPDSSDDDEQPSRRSYRREALDPFRVIARDRKSAANHVISPRIRGLHPSHRSRHWRPDLFKLQSACSGLGQARANYSTDCDSGQADGFGEELHKGRGGA
jgi:hypothetical protein